MKAIADLSGDVNDRLALADHYLIWNKPDEGLAILTEMAAREGSYGAATVRIAAYRYARGETKEAHRCLDEVLTKNRSDARAWLLRARFLARENKAEEAVARTLDAIKADPQLADAHYFLAQHVPETGEHPPGDGGLLDGDPAQSAGSGGPGRTGAAESGLWQRRRGNYPG